MAATKDVSPSITASQLNTIMAKTVANMTIDDLRKLNSALDRISSPAGGDPRADSTATITSLFT